jgi:hypothetical protein
MMNDPTQNRPTAQNKKPNVVYFLVDNLGMGELIHSAVSRIASAWL